MHFEVSGASKQKPGGMRHELKSERNVECGMRNAGFVINIYWRVSMGLTVSRKTAKNLAVRRNNERLETLRSRLFGISREPRTSRSHVTTALASGLQFEVHVFTAGPRSRGK